MRRAFGPQVEFVAGVYQDPPPDVTGREVIIVDFSYKRPVLETMAAGAQSILILDHHKSAMDELAGLPAAPPLRPESGLGVLFDLERSGAGLAWDYFCHEKRPPLLGYAGWPCVPRGARLGGRRLSQAGAAPQRQQSRRDKLRVSRPSPSRDLLALIPEAIAARIFPIVPR